MCPGKTFANSGLSGLELQDPGNKPDRVGSTNAPVEA